jgi:hypothetical protein
VRDIKGRGAEERGYVGLEEGGVEPITLNETLFVMR